MSCTHTYIHTYLYIFFFLLQANIQKYIPYIINVCLIMYYLIFDIVHLKSVPIRFVSWEIKILINRLRSLTFYNADEHFVRYKIFLQNMTTNTAPTFSSLQYSNDGFTIYIHFNTIRYFELSYHQYIVHD